MRLFRRKATVRRATLFEISTALGMAFFHIMNSNHIDEGYQEMDRFIQGPLRGAFTEALTLIVNKGEYAEWGDHGLLIKKFN